MAAKSALLQDESRNWSDIPWLSKRHRIFCTFGFTLGLEMKAVA